MAHKDIVSLLTKKGRKAQRQFLAEGVRLMEEAVRHRRRPVAVYWCPTLLSERGQALVAKFSRLNVEVKEVTARQIEAMSDTEAPQGIVGRFVIPAASPAELLARPHRKVLMCEQIADPGNVGTLLRSALAFGFPTVALVGNSAEPYSPKVVRASSGALFGLHVVACPLEPFLAALPVGRADIVAADVHGTVGHRELRPASGERTLVLAVGSESDGLSGAVLERAAVRVRIDHAKAVESLNAAVAGSILMSEIYYAERGTMI